MMINAFRNKKIFLEIKIVMRASKFEVVTLIIYLE